MKKPGAVVRETELSPDQVRALLEASPDPQFRGLVTAYAATGCRPLRCNSPTQSS